MPADPERIGDRPLLLVLGFGPLFQAMGGVLFLLLVAAIVLAGVAFLKLVISWSGRVAAKEIEDRSSDTGRTV